MAATDGQITLAASRFGDTTPVYLRDFAKSELPAVAKIIKGQYHNLGVPTLSNPSLQSTALFLNAGKKYQILAQPIKIKDGRKPTNVGPKVLIPETYPGYFELLSEDGRSTRCIETVADLSRKQNLRVLVRETFRCNHLMKTIHAGDILTTMYENGKYLKCRTQKDEVVSLPLEAKAKFSPIAKEESISGVHSVRNLLKKRMPVIVRLVYGTAPKGLKQPFVPELRLLGCVEIDRVFALPLQKDTDLVAVPLNAKLKLQRAKNMDQLGNFIEYLRFLDKAQRLLAEARDRLQIVDIKLSDKDKKDAKGHANNPLHCLNLIPGLENGYVLRKSISCDSARYVHGHQQPQHNALHNASHPHHGHHQHGHHTGAAGSHHDLSPILDDYNDIDQIYDYVRGLAPLPKNLNRFESPPMAGLSASDQQQTLASSTTTNTSTSIHKSPSTDMAKSQPDSGNYSLIRTGNNSNNNNSINSSSGHHSSQHNNNNGSSNHNHSHYHQHHSHHHSSSASTHNHNHTSNSAMPYNGHHAHDDRPIPPPIETIPGKKLPEKRQRPTLPKLYVKNNSVTGGVALAMHPKTGVTASSIANGAVGHHSPSVAAAAVSASAAVGLSGYAINAKDGLEPQSPLFHIRYKSLSSLQLTPDSNPTTPSPTGGLMLKNGLMAAGAAVSGNPSAATGGASAHQAHTPTGHHHHAHHAHHSVEPLGHPLMKSASTQCAPREGTLDSSRSGGRTSGDSNKLPEKKTRRLSRPRSLSNLVWELRPQKDKSKKKLYVHHYDNRQQPQTTLYL